MAHGPKWRRLGCLLCGVGAALLCLAAPLRAQSGDPVPGRLEALTLACHGTFDLREVSWIAEQASRGHMIYYAQRAPNGSVISAFGPAPAIVGLAGMGAIKPGAVLGYKGILRRARYGAAIALGVSTWLLCVAIVAEGGIVRAFVGAATAAASFAGCGTLGQGPWQQTAALPFLVGALAVLAWSARRPRLMGLLPPLLVVAWYARPASAGMLAGIGLAALLLARRDARARKPAAFGCALAIAVAVPVAIGWQRYAGTPLPVGGQYGANLELARGAAIWDFSPSHIAHAALALLASPARGLLWYAPGALLAAAVAVSDRSVVKSAIVAGMAAQLLLVCGFFNWWGGTSYGPRLLAEEVWIGAWVVFSTSGPWSRSTRTVLGVAAGWTIAVGLLGLARFDPRAWELRQPAVPDFWGVRDNPIAALVTHPPPDGEQLLDMPEGPYVYCSGPSLSLIRGSLTRATPRSPTTHPAPSPGEVR